MHAPVSARMGKKLGKKLGQKPALEPKTAIGPAMQALAGHILAGARAAMTDPQRSNGEAVHAFRRAMKEWRALTRLLAPFVDDADRWRSEGRDRAHALALARDGAAALNAFNGLVGNGSGLSERSAATVRRRLQKLRGSEERAVLTAELRASTAAWLDAAAEAVEQWPLDLSDFSSLAAQLTAGYRRARKRMPPDWSLASDDELHRFRRRVVDHRYQMELVEPLWPRFARMWMEEAERLRGRLGKCQDLAVLERLTEPHQPLAHWRARLMPACAERRATLSHRAERIARRLFAEKPKAFRRRLQTLWEQEK